MALTFRGLPTIVLATAVAGVAGYLVTWVVYRQIGPADYAVFAVFWAALYLVIGGCPASSRRSRAPHGAWSRAPATRRAPRATSRWSPRLLVVVAIVASAPLWATAVFGDVGWALVLPLALGAGSYVLVATLGGLALRRRSLGLARGHDRDRCAAASRPAPGRLAVHPRRGRARVGRGGAIPARDHGAVADHPARIRRSHDARRRLRGTHPQCGAHGARRRSRRLCS